MVLAEVSELIEAERGANQLEAQEKDLEIS